MKTFLKVVIFLLIAWIVVHLLPLLIVPLLAVGVVLVCLGSAAAGGVALAAGLGLTVAAAVGTILLVVLTISAPLWIPVLMLLGLLMIIFKVGRRILA